MSAPAVASTEDYIPGLTALEGGTETPGHRLASPSSGWWVKQSSEQTINAAGQPSGYRHQLMHGRKVISSGVGADCARTFRKQADYQNTHDEQALHPIKEQTPNSADEPPKTPRD